jgi:putative pyruvate formate lyase activating enzyme
LANLATGEEGFAMHGRPIRHLMLPGDLAGSEKVLAFIASEISCNT